MSNSISLYFEERKPTVVVEKTEEGGVRLEFNHVVHTFSESEASMLASSIRIVLGQEKVAESKEKVTLA